MTCVLCNGAGKRDISKVRGQPAFVVCSCQNTARDWALSLKNRATRLARLVELNAPLNILINERKLVDIAFFGAVNLLVQANPPEIEKQDQLKRLVTDLRIRTDVGDFRLNEDGAVALLTEFVREAAQQAVINQCEKQTCPWFKELEEQL